MENKMKEKIDFMENLKNQLKSAYRKYKTSIYYDNYSAIQRYNLAKFEVENFLPKSDEYLENIINSSSNEVNNNFSINSPELDKYIESKKDKTKFEDYFTKLAEKITANNNFKEIISQIEVISVPKKIKSSNSSKNVITNINKSSNEIEQIHYFIDLPVEGHILGVLWILRCGYALDDKLYKNCYGNRLNDSLLEKLKDENEYNTENEYLDISPFLFQPYYKKYQSWRDNGLNSVEQLLKNEENAIMFSLDLKDYYYRSLIDFELLFKDIECAKKRISNDFKEYNNEENEENKINKNLNKFIEQVFKEYSLKFTRIINNEPIHHPNNKEYSEKNNPNYKELPMIPLGFLPSLIIANWNLQGLDQAILENIHPYYYGRYVDDMLIVMESHDKSESHGIAHIEELSLKEFMIKYLTGESDNPLNFIFKEENTNNEENKEENINYRIYNQLDLQYDQLNKIDSKKRYYPYENLEIQGQKLRIYKFSHENSDAMIKNFKKEIYKNSSEFKLMHGLSSMLEELQDKIYQIEYDESINKLNNIKNVKINKFEISKLLSRLNHESKYIRGNMDPEVISWVLDAFKGNILEFMILWEKIFSFLYINNQHEELINFINDIINLINSISYNEKNNDKTIMNEENKSNNKENKNKTNNNEENETTLNSSYIFNLKKSNKNSYDNNGDVVNLKKSLFEFLYFSLIRTLSLKSSNKCYENVLERIYNIFEKIFGENLFESTKIDLFNYIFSSMQNNSLMTYPLQNTSEIEFNIILNHPNYHYDLIKHNQTNKTHGLFDGIYYPRYVKFNEFMLNEINEEVFENKTNQKQISPYLENAITNYYKFNFNEKNENNFLLNRILNSLCKSTCPNFIPCPNNSKSVEILNINGDKKESLKIGLLNTKLNKENFINRINNDPNLTSERFDKIKKLINESIKKEVELLIMPEMYIPYEWVNEIVRIAKDHQMAIIFGVEPLVQEKNIGNYIMYALPFSIDEKYYECALFYRLKNHYSPEELKIFEKYEKNAIKINTFNLDEENNNPLKKYHLIIWNDVYIAPYYCYEIADIQDRSIFKSCCDIITVSEFNKDTKYFNNIAESLSRDLFCYCIKSNTSEFGGNTIIQPSSSEEKYLINLKGGDDDYIVTHLLDIKKLRENAIKSDKIHDNTNRFKPKPPGFFTDVVKKRK